MVSLHLYGIQLLFAWTVYCGRVPFQTDSFTVDITTQSPIVECNSTGPTCLRQCEGGQNGLYQSCKNCTHFIQCANGVPYYQACPEELVFDDSAKVCVRQSTTCEECYTVPTTITESTPGMTSDVTDTSMTPTSTMSTTRGYYGGQYRKILIARVVYLSIVNRLREHYV
jgi:hypothetical protein